MPSRRIRRPVAPVLLLLATLACDEDSPGEPPPILPQQALDTRVSISPATIALGDTAWVTVTVRNTHETHSVVTTTSNGCPVLEPLVMAGSKALRPFGPTCLSLEGRDAIDPAHTSLDLAPGEMVHWRFPFTGTAVEVLGNTRCNVVGRFDIWVASVAEPSHATLLSGGFPRRAAKVTGEVVAPAGTPTCS